MGMDPQYTLDDALQHAARSLAQGTGGAGAAAGQSAPTTAAATQGQANAQGGSTPVRPLRAMLARGAACDTCRARKVKCDASRPFCTPCLKSSRGDSALALTKCKYEGTRVAGRGGRCLDVRVRFRSEGERPCGRIFDDAPSATGVPNRPPSPSSSRQLINYHPRRSIPPAPSPSRSNRNFHIHVQHDSPPRSRIRLQSFSRRVGQEGSCGGLGGEDRGA
ncbi:hypothetical protein AAT19DRAFT_10097 [Rhodotorula toruloides]|uniref:Zn(2)-C6 fungal-type domain-containing protein n=1 Tax=Rhodotorula toruloides TaxID=5286 RepID=A0A2S9ZZQ9_RHOTO|nr:hypothetical protein AAT19DRAFT_10097 [Rhodotorula toruloides]